MSIYLTPWLRDFDEETSGSEDSVYVTPEVSSIDSVFNKNFSPLSCNECDRKLTKIHRLDCPVAVNNMVRRKRKFMSDIIGDKENLKISPSSITRLRRSNDGIPLKCVTTLFNPDRRSNEFQFEKNLRSELPEKINIIPQVKKVDEGNITSAKSTQTNLFQRLKLMRTSKTRCSHLNRKEVYADAETIVVRIPETKGCGPITLEHSKKKSPVESKQKSLYVSARTFSFSVLRKCRLVQLKRIFTRPVTRIRSCYTKYLQKFRMKRYQSLHPSVCEDNHNFTNVSEAQSENLVEKEKQKLPATPNVQDLLQTVISKLSCMEQEMKELKILLKENKNSGSITCFPGPPPPPLPPPPPPLPLNLFNHGSTPKRKVDLTTPENQQLAKRPSRAQEQRGQFSVTVEDLKNVKLRKIGNQKMNLGRNAIKEPMSLPSKRTHTMRYKHNSVVNQERSDNTTAELFSPRSTSITTETILMGSPETTPGTFLNLNIFEQTPRRIKCRSSMLRRRGDLLNDPST